MGVPNGNKANLSFIFSHILLALRQKRWQVPLVEQELLTLPKSLFFCLIRVAQYLVFCVVLFVLFILTALSFDIQFLVIHLVFCQTKE
jgi:hypothetical protein